MPDLEVFRIGDMGLSNNFITEILIDARHNLWVGSDGGGLDRWDPSSGQFVAHRNHPADPQSLLDNNIEALYADRDGGIWIGHHQGVSYLNGSQKPFRFFPRNGVITSLCPAPKDKLWIGLDDGGLELFDRNQGTALRFRHQPGNPQSICDNDVISILQDSRQNLWIGTWGGGLTKISSEGDYSHFLPDGRPGSIGDNDILSFLEDKQGHLWIGTADNCLNHYDPSTGRFQSLQWPESDPGDLFKNWVVDLCEDPGGQIWVATTWGIAYLDREAMALEHIPVDHHFIKAIHPSRSEGLWLGTDQGLLLFNPKDKTIQRWQQCSRP